MASKIVTMVGKAGIFWVLPRVYAVGMRIVPLLSYSSIASFKFQKLFNIYEIMSLPVAVVAVWQYFC
jgi:hypothetical protein